VRQRPAAQVQQLQALVERGGVAGLDVDHRVDPGQVAGEQAGLQQRLAGAHPVAVALDRVDLAVVRDEPVRVRQLPGRERVGREPRVHQRDRAGEAAVRQVGEERLQLGGGEHPLVDHGAAGQAGKVDPDVLLGALAHAEHGPVEFETGLAGVRAALGGGDEQLLEVRHGLARRRTREVGVERQLAPPEDRQALLRAQRGDVVDGGGPLVAVGRQEADARGVPAGLGQGEVADLAEERVRYLDEDADPVAVVRLGAHGTAVVEVLQDGQGVLNDVVALTAVQVGDHPDPAGVMLVGPVVEPLVRGRSGSEGSSSHQPSRRRHVTASMSVQSRDDVGPAAV
jgi:hypothetical protein